MKVRRIVIGTNEAGESVFMSDEANPNTKVFSAFPGLAVARIWQTEQTLTTSVPDQEPTKPAGPILPKPGETAFMINQYPPDSAAMSVDFNPAAAGQEFFDYSPDMAATMAPDGMHRTDSVDIAIVLTGKIWIELDGGAETELEPGDTIVQLGGRHAWRNKTSEPATVAFILVGAERI